MTDVFDRVLVAWRPAPVSVSRTLLPARLKAFSDLLDETVPLEPGAPVPMLWHWLAFWESCPQSALGEDGHPRDGHFLPPFENRRRMMAGGRLEQQEPFVVGATYERRSELTDAVVKQGRSGRMLFTTVRHTFRDAGGGVVAVEDEDIVYREQPSGQARRLPSPPPVDEAWHSGRGARGRLVFPTDPRVLFRFSALTYNTHRIHYDAPYGTGVEGYPGLVVHGPLLALHMLELPRRAAATPTRFEYRLQAPAFSGPAVVVTWDDDGLAAGSEASAGASATASVTF